MAGGRHRTDESSGGVLKYASILVIAAVVVVAGVVVFQVVRGAGCSSTTQVTLDADPALAAAVTEAVDATDAQDRGCTDFAVAARGSATTMNAVLSGAGAPQLWIPESTRWVTKVNRSADLPVDIAAPSVASSPVVIAAQGAAAPTATWIDALRTPGVRLGNTRTSAVAEAPILAAAAEQQRSHVDPAAAEQAMVAAAQAQSARMSADAQAAGDGGVVDPADAVRTGAGAAVLTEQQAVGLGPQVTETVPQAGTVFMDFPLVVSAPRTQREDAEAAAQELAGVLESDAGRAALSEHGFRVGGAPLPAGAGVGDVPEITIGDPQSAEAALTKWSALAVPVRSLVVFDVSGSMSYTADAEHSRMQLTQQAARIGESLFPDNAMLGVWAFSLDLDGPQRDHRELVPVRRLDAQTDGGTQRDAVRGAVDELGGLVGGGTGLYDTVDAAYRQVQSTYDPNAVNSVIVLTDGENEDPVSLSKDQLLTRLQQDSDPARPVLIITIGITDDADAEVLQEISDATGGSSYLARDPADIPQVFARAIAQRGT